MVEAVSAVLGAGGVTIVGKAGDGVEALVEIERHRPDVAVVDVLMPRLSGIEVARRAALAAPATAVILYTGYGDAPMLAEALAAGARGFVLKESPMEDVLHAVRAVAAGGQYVDPVLSGSLLLAPGTRLPKLTQREREALALLAAGLSNEEIGRRLAISPETVRSHLRKAMSKLGADTRTQAVATALRLHLIS